MRIRTIYVTGIFGTPGKNGNLFKNSKGLRFRGPPGVGVENDHNQMVIKIKI